MYLNHFLATLGVVVLLVLIAAANLANLRLVDNESRRHETGIRLALGAGRGDLARQHMLETLLLSAMGTAAGLVVAAWLIRGAPALLYGAPEIVQQPLPFTSSYLSSGWVSLRHEWQGNRSWVGLNALIPGGGHQHSDRLTLLSYMQGQLLALEKATPYNDSLTRTLGTVSPSHNTVTVDMTTQKKGDTLKGDQVPQVTFFFSGPLAAFAELRADQLYPQMRRYRRSVVMVEDLYADCFQVTGGTNHDWMFHHTGPAPRFSMPVREGAFVPADWLASGTTNVRRAQLDATWDRGEPYTTKLASPVIRGWLR